MHQDRIKKKFLKDGKKRVIVKCLYCTNEYETAYFDVVYGKSTRCKQCRYKKVSKKFKKHGLSYTPIYSVWRNEKERCYNPNNPQYKDYGGRSITIAKEFKDSFETWYEYVTSLDSYKENWQELELSLDRIDNDKGYERGNLRWADRYTQVSNQRRPKNITTNYTGVQKSGRNISISVTHKGNTYTKSGFDSIKEALEARNRYILDNNLPHLIQDYTEPMDDMEHDLYEIVNEAKEGK